MDELLSLFGAEHGDPPKNETDVAPTGVDDVNTNFGEAFGRGQETTAVKIKTKTSSNHSFERNTHNANSSVVYPTKKPAAATKHNNCDPYTGLRIVDRRTSRADMIDAFSSFTYKSCSMLAASSRAEWGTYLVDGGGSGGGVGGAPSGKTNLATCGILTSDTSSRISSKTRRAFAMLSLGDLPSSMQSRGYTNNNNISASISVFLFGDALSMLRTNKKYLNAGWAVAILGPNLMPPRTDDKNGGSTSVTLSINDPRQILPIGRAIDCDRCKGTVRVKVASEYGGTRWDESRCSTLVDLRVSGGYCQMHRRQGLSYGSGGKSKSGNKTNSNMTFMQQQRMQGMQQQSMPTKGGVPTTRGNVGSISFKQGLSHMPGRGASNLSEALGQSGLFEPAPTALMIDSKQRMLKRAPLHMKKQALKNSSQSVPTTNVAKKNPYHKSQSSALAKKRKQPEDILGEALGRKRSKAGGASVAKKSTTISAPKSKQPSCKVFNTGEGFSGAVPVPKPSAVLFQRKAASSLMDETPSSAGNNLSVESARSILDRQRNLAGLLKNIDSSTPSSQKRNITVSKEALARSKQKILGKGGTVIKQTARSGQASLTDNNNDFASAFGNVSGIFGDTFDRDAILNAKSCFASDANAQEYARARAAVQELECREVTKEGKKSGAKDGKAKAEPSIVTTAWVCRSCRKKTPFKPTSCIRSKHDVRQQREIKGGSKSLGSRKNRLHRHGKDAEEGGLTLGSGLEWSGWRGELG